jgi:hypothetical protein
MRRRTRSRLGWLAAGAIGAVALWSAPSAPAPPDTRSSGGGADPLAISTAPANVIQPQPPPGSCRVGGSGQFTLPDPRCTPGAINPTVAQRNIAMTICRDGRTASVRAPDRVTEPEKLASMGAFAERGPFRRYEYDHLIPLELGGAVNDPRNLWPEPGASPNPTDSLERTLNSLVCRRQLELRDAQQLIATDWVTAYRRFVSPGGTR